MSVIGAIKKVVCSLGDHLGMLSGGGGGVKNNAGLTGLYLIGLYPLKLKVPIVCLEPEGRELSVKQYKLMPFWFQTDNIGSVTMGRIMNSTSLLNYPIVTQPAGGAYSLKTLMHSQTRIICTLIIIQFGKS